MVSTLLHNDGFIGKYRLVSELASGAFGRVYRAEDTSQSNRIVALKLMHSTNLDSPQEHESFLQEAKFLKMLNHPYILPVLDVGIAENIPYMVTEYAPNGSLLDRLTQAAPRLIRQQEVLLMLAQIGSALHYAHQLNIIHRDLKPANILFNANGDAVLADFGIATMLASSIKYGTAVGTPYYMAPEQFRGSISKEGDQYALGCIAYELLTGRVPFTAPDFFSLGYKHMTEKPIDPTQLNLLLPRATEQAVLKAMAKQRTDRFPDIAAFLKALGVPSSSAIAMPRLATVPPPPLTHPYTRSLVTSVNLEKSGGEAAHTLLHSFQRNNPSSHPLTAHGVSPAMPTSRTRTPDREITGHAIPAISRQAILPAATKQHPEAAEQSPQAPSLSELATISPSSSSPLPTGSTFTPEETLPRVLDSPGSQPLPPQAHLHRLPSRVIEVAALPPQHQLSAGNDTALTAPPREDPLPMAVLVSTATPFMPPFEQHQRPQRGPQKWLIMACAGLLFLFLAGSILSFALLHWRAQQTLSPTSALLPVTALVTITPAHSEVSATYTLAAVTGQPNASQNQVQARLLSSYSPTQSKTLSASGKGTTPATPSHGMLTFWNDSTSSKTFSAGMVFTGADGIQITNDAGGTLPPGNPTTPLWTSVTVAAHSIQGGTTSNIKVTDVNSWSSYGDGYFVVQNDSPFGGGENAQGYTYIQSSDYAAIQGEANLLKSSLLPNTQAAVTAQVRTNETLLNAVQCTSNASYNHKTGDHALSITTTVTVTCRAEVYNLQAAKNIATALFSRKLASTPNTGYTLVNTITTSLEHAVLSDAQGTISLLIKADSIGIFHFSDIQRQGLATLILGKNEQEAQRILLSQAGISQVVISLSGGNGHTLPSDTHHITLNILN